MQRDARLFLGALDAGDHGAYAIEPGRGVWLQVARGIIALNGTELREGDGAAVESEPSLAIEAETEAEILLFDLG